ncbi:MG(2+) CHELATASE FAMILY PROTEIN / ComM-related protein [plant metagenome]|uniref:MG(2+) CHELATASE FAMILY PROTEIN / ComM-related protein n=1 Tax=plant metagenome TaxID=1297885 RepID=A0A484XRL6_9ZZZZ
MTLAVLASRALSGLHAPAVRVEVHLAPGLPAFHVVGLPDAEVRESRERVRAALLNSGFDFPAGRLTVNLAPADLPKESGRFDLPIALGVLLASGQLTLPEHRQGGAASGESVMTRLVLAGELSLTGALVPVAAALAIALSVARSQPGATLILPRASAGQAARVPGVTVLGADTLQDVVAHLAGETPLSPPAVPALPGAGQAPCLRDVRGQSAARRALEVAAAGGHGLLMIGSPGTGKSMLAQRLPGLLPPLSEADALEAAAVASLGAVETPFSRVPPFRAPHHGASAASLVGGGARPRAGEITLAHLGVLFLDELPEFDRRALEALREPLETGRVGVARAMWRVEYPARFQLVAAMNPCPCGWHGHPVRLCHCTPEAVQRYRGRISGPLLDRIDLQVSLPAPEAGWLDLPPGEPSAPVRARVEACRARQWLRQGMLNAALPPSAVDAHCRLPDEARVLLNRAMERLGWSARSAHRVLRVARTVSDLAGSDTLRLADVAEAIQYRRQLGV